MYIFKLNGSIKKSVNKWKGNKKEQKHSDIKNSGFLQKQKTVEV